MTTASLFIEKSRQLLVADYLPKIDVCLRRLSDADIWWRPNETSNSVGNLVLHLCGNVTQWILGGVGGRPFERNRQQEFDERNPLPSSQLVGKLTQVVRQADDVLAGLTDVVLLERRLIQNHDVTVLEAVYHVVEHFGMHTGQIVLIAKARLDEDLGLWKPRP